jgi:hypothetical protein
MKKAAIAVVLLLIAVSCSQGGIKEVDVHTGTDGLVMQFEPMAPPSTAFEGDAIPITLKLMNKGAQDIQNGYYTISVEKAYMTLEGQPTESFSVNGRTAYDPRGGELLIRKGAFVGYLDPMTETLSTSMTATACYGYKTTASANVCIDTDLFGQNPQKVCSVSDVQFPANGQGGPVAITRIEPKMKQHPDDPNKIIPQFLVYIANRGNGQCIEPSKTNAACTGASISPEYWNTAVVKVSLLDQQLDCRPKIRPDYTGAEGHIKFSRDASKEDFIRCELAEGIEKVRGTYTSSLQADIEYGYTTTISSKLQIKKD